ncbi:hypothetical protein F4703DRAFT_1527250 [Phycomyces blakesleeanus]
MTTTPSERFGVLPKIELPACLEFLKLKNFPLKTYPSVYQPPRLTKDTLYIFGPGWRNTWGSFDAECLQFQIYLKFAGLEFDVINSNEPDASPSGKLPFLATVPGAIYHDQQIHKWIDDMGKSQVLAGEHSEDAKAFISLANTKLNAALIFSMWLEPLNYSKATSEAYFGHVPAPVDYILAYKKQNKVVQQLLADRDILVREEIYSDAVHALEALSVKLGEATYFFGSSGPTWIDAVIFSYIHIILGAPQFTDSSVSDEEKRQASTLRNLVLKHDNLVRFAKNIREKYL